MDLKEGTVPLLRYSPPAMLVALTRGVSPAIDRCELTHLDREPIEFERAREQHREYERCLEDLGFRVERLSAEPDFPDSVFVEDIALVLAEIAIITRPGAASRRGERPSVATTLEPYRDLASIRSPGVLDGGDVLTVGKQIYVGLSTRSNSESVRQLRDIVSGFGYSVTDVEFRNCLHLKSAVTQVAGDALLLNPGWVDGRAFEGLRSIEVDSSEPSAANVLLTGESVLVAAEHPKTAARLESEGFEVRTVEASELAKAEGGLTCCSLLFDVGSREDPR